MKLRATGQALLGLLLLSCTTSHAEQPTEALRNFFAGLKTLQADFEQQVVDEYGRVQQSSRGHMWIMRPGRFRWDYEEPYRQQIVADGTRLWSYDEDLEQVTVQPADKVLTATPAMLLSGEQPLEQVFTLEDDGDSVRLLPKTDDSNITALNLYLEAGVLQEITAQDSFGNTTTFRFSRLERNPSLAADLFVFVPPAGADVVGDVQ
ncbi:MAG: outer membrane lipoprotein chaperone LolA [Gammaproteobacteria bacterium]|jgi:outer membrane lipoprotein carrier protein